MCESNIFFPFFSCKLVDGGFAVFYGIMWWMVMMKVGLRSWNGPVVSYALQLFQDVIFRCSDNYFSAHGTPSNVVAFISLRDRYQASRASRSIEFDHSDKHKHPIWMSLKSRHTWATYFPSSHWRSSPRVESVEKRVQVLPRSPHFDCRKSRTNNLQRQFKLLYAFAVCHQKEISSNFPHTQQ